MNILDSSAWIECLINGPGAGHFGHLLRQPDQMIVPTLCFTEVARWFTRTAGPEAAAAVAAIMRQARVIPLNESIALHAAAIGLTLKLPQADSIIYATTLSQHATLWTQDAHFKALPDVKFFPKAA